MMTRTKAPRVARAEAAAAEPTTETDETDHLSALPEDGRYGFSIENGTRATSPRRNKVGPMQ